MKFNQAATVAGSAEGRKGDLTMHTDSYGPEFRTCRFCKRMETSLLKYGVRQYAHGNCLLAAKGTETFDLLPLAELNRFPYFVAKEYGLLAALESAIAQKEAK